MWDWDLVSGEMVWAGTIEPYFQMSPDRMAEPNASHYHIWAERVHPDDLAATEAAAQAAIAGGAESWQHEYRFRRVDGTYADILERAFISRDGNGKALRALGAMEDVTARKAAEMSEGLLTRRSAGHSAECSAPISKRGRSSMVGGPKGAL